MTDAEKKIIERLEGVESSVDDVRRAVNDRGHGIGSVACLLLFLVLLNTCDINNKIAKQISITVEAQND